MSDMEYIEQLKKLLDWSRQSERIALIRIAELEVQLSERDRLITMLIGDLAS